MWLNLQRRASLQTQSTYPQTGWVQGLMVLLHIGRCCLCLPHAELLGQDCTVLGPCHMGAPMTAAKVNSTPLQRRGGWRGTVYSTGLRDGTVLVPCHTPAGLEERCVAWHLCKCLQTNIPS